MNACSGFDKVIIFLGSSNESRTAKNPLTFEERAVLLTAALPADLAKKSIAIPLADIESWVTWIGLVKDSLKQFTTESDTITFVAFNKDEATTKMNVFVEENGFEFLPVCSSQKAHFMNATNVRLKLSQGVSPEDIIELHPSTKKLLSELNLLNVFYQST